MVRQNETVLVAVLGFIPDRADALQVLWGNPAAGVCGRVSRGLEEALFYERLQVPVTLMFMGGGVSVAGGTIATYNYELARSRQAEVAHDPALAKIINSAVVDVHASTTSEEVAVLARYCAVHTEVTRVVIVTSPFHRARVDRDVDAAKERGDFAPTLHLCSVAADTNPQSVAAGAVVVMEPPCRPNQLPWHELGAYLVAFMQAGDPLATASYEAVRATCALYWPALPPEAERS